MTGVRSLCCLAACLLLCPAGAQSATTAANPQPTARANLIVPSSFSKYMDMDFGALTVTTAGTAVIDSTNDTLTTTGGVLAVGGTPHAAGFDAVSPSKTVVKISLPKQAVTLTRIGGTETMTVDTWTVNGASSRNVVAHQEFKFQVGGTLHVGANQAQGTYLGTFDVTLNYN